MSDTGGNMEPEAVVEFDPRLKSPFTMMICGPTGCGKSHLVFQLISNVDKLITPKVSDITFCYSQWQTGYEKMRDLGVKFHKGMFTRQELFNDKKDVSKPCLLVLDDLLDPEYAPLVRDLFVKGSHHLNMNVIFITQNIFFSSNKDYRTVSINSNYIVVFKNPREMNQISYLSRQAFPKQPRFLTEVYNTETEREHSYIVLDCKQSTPDHLRVRGSITTPWKTAVFIPDSKNKNKK